MTGRRRAPRYVFLPPIGGRARTIADCVVESWEGDRAVVVTTRAARPGEEFVIEFDEGPGGPRTCAARVVSSVPDLTHGVARWRLLVTTSFEAPGGRVEPSPGA